MSWIYSPNPGASLVYPYTTVLLSQRDLGSKVPINYVTIPGVSVSAACFSHLRYEDESAQNCISNLLAIGFRRFELDLFWDQWRQLWSFCPVAVPPSFSSTASALTATTSTGTGSSSATGSAAILTSSSSLLLPSLSGQSLSTKVTDHQPTSVISPIPQAHTTTTGLLESSGTPLGQSVPSISSVPDTSSEPLFSGGPYSCTSTINLSSFVSQLLDYIRETENTIQANLLYITLNVHAAAEGSSPTSPAPVPSALPFPPNLLSSLFSAPISTYVYTSTDLRTDRENINGSWYTVSEDLRPIAGFYSTHLDEHGIMSTKDGWPSESYVEFSRGKRLLLGYGTVDPQMSNYNFTGDEDIVFPSGYIQDSQPNINASSTGETFSGCFLQNNASSLSQVNSSWATATNISGFEYPTSPSSNLYSLLNLTNNLTKCGISSLLNITLLNSTADDNFAPYQDYSYATIWSWAPGEPKNSTSDDEARFRCASANQLPAGRWTVNDCSAKYYAACRAKGQPYNWTITAYSTPYASADQACPKGYEFAVPRTALENSYLFQAIGSNVRDYDGKGVWVDLNCLNTADCWVSGGPNATCPYASDLYEEMMNKRYVLVPTVAAIIVLVIAGLTLFVKMAGNRRVRKRTRKRADNGAIYEGVPS